MIQSQARQIIADLRASIRIDSYEHADKRHLAVLFGDIRQAIALTPFPDLMKRDEVSKLEKQFMEDRCDAAKDCGAASIETILGKLEGHISVLPAEIKPGEIIIQTQAQKNTAAVIEELRKQGLVLASA